MHFRPITLQDKDLISHFTTPNNPKECLSDFNFTNLLIWQSAREISIASSKDYLIIRTQYPQSEPYFFYPFASSPTQSLELISTLLELYPTLSFKSLTQAQAQELELHFPNTFEITPNRDRFDYVYSIPELISLSGRKYHKKKNHLNKFLQSYPNFSFENITQENAPQVLNTYEKWFASNPNQDSSLLAEKQGIQTLLTHFSTLSTPDCNGLFALQGGMLKLQEQIIAFALGEAISTQSVVIHIEKGNIAYQGIYQAINQQFLAQVFSAYEWVNREEDLGIEGLRKAKLSYQPSFLLEKYEAIRKWTTLEVFSTPTKLTRL